jgi:hypothetical protein
MTRPVRIVGALGALALASAAAAGAAPTFTLEPNEVGGGATVCAKGKKATAGGYVAGLATRWEVLGSSPAGRRWRVRLRNNSAGAEEVEAKALCRPGKRYKVVTRRVELTLDPVSAYDRTLRARCPVGTTLAGGGFAPAPGLGDQPSTGFNVLANRPAGARRWLVRFTGYSDPGGSFTLEARAVCDRRGAEYAVRTDSDTPAPRLAPRRGDDAPIAMRAECPRGTRITGGGFSSREDVNVNYTRIRARNNAWAIDGGAQSDHPITAYAVCRK